MSQTISTLIPVCTLVFMKKKLSPTVTGHQFNFMCKQKNILRTFQRLVVHEPLSLVVKNVSGNSPFANWSLSDCLTSVSDNKLKVNFGL